MHLTAGDPMTELTRLTATDARNALAAGQITSRDLVAASLARIAARQPVIAAWAHLDPDQALAQADAADQRQRAGTPLGPLHGVPVGIKDIIDTADLPTENGTPVFKGRRPAADAEAVRRLKAAGAVILGKTVTTELAFFGPGPTRNPVDPERTPGGSSSGSAAAVADFQVPLALGSQTAGSILRPASYCGVPGFKPTFGLLPLEGVLAQSPPLDTLGGYARSMADLALLTEVLSGRMIVRPALAKRPLRLAFVKTPAWPQGDGTMRAAFEDLVGRHGEVIVEVALPEVFAETAGLQRAVQFRDIARAYGPIADTHPDVISGKLKDVIAEGRTVSDADYLEACGRRDSLYASLEDMLEAFDAILTPAAPGVAPAGLSSTGSPMFNFLWTYLGCPAISVPLLSADGLPLGVQLVGARGADGALLAVAEAAMEQLGR